MAEPLSKMGSEPQSGSALLALPFSASTEIPREQIRPSLALGAPDCACLYSLGLRYLCDEMARVSRGLSS